MTVFTMPMAELNSRVRLHLAVREGRVNVRSDRKDPADAG